jgi:hypothetical protein
MRRIFWGFCIKRFGIGPLHLWLLPDGRRGSWQEVGEAPGRRQERLLAGDRIGSRQVAGAAPGRRQERHMTGGRRSTSQEA